MSSSIDDLNRAAKKVMRDHDLVEKDLRAVMHHLKSGEAAWQDYKNSTGRFAVYDYVDAITTIIRKFATTGKIKSYVKLAAAMKGLQPMKKTTVAVVIDCTADDLSKSGPRRRSKAQKQRSKWARAILAAKSQGVSPSKTAAYLRRHGMSVVLKRSKQPRKR